MRGTGGKLDIETRWAQEVVDRTGEAEAIETKCMQEVAERHRGAGEIRILKQHKGKKLWRGQRGEPYMWNQMDAGSWKAHWGKRKLDIGIRWAQ